MNHCLDLIFVQQQHNENKALQHKAEILAMNETLLLLDLLFLI